MSSLAVWVEYMMVPSGLRMAMGDEASRLFLTGRLLVQKWAVLPVSAIVVEVKAGWWEDLGLGRGMMTRQLDGTPLVIM
jgi:hypothetical protein